MLRCSSLLFVLVVAALGQDPPAPAPDTKPIDDAIAGLKRAHKEKLEADYPHFIKILGETWANARPEQRREIFDLADKNLKLKSQDAKLATIEALSKMNGGEKGKDAETAAKILTDEAGKKATEENPAYFGKVLIAMGKLESPKGKAFLLKHLKYKDFDVVAAAADGLGSYKNATIDEKKEIVGEMLKTYTGVASAANDPRATSEKDRLKKIEGSMEHALKSLTGQSTIVGAPKWWSWWQDTGKKAKAW